MSFPENLPKPRAPLTFDKSIKDYENPQSVVMMVAPYMKDAINKLPDSRLNLTEEEAEVLLVEPTATVSQLRHMFWLEYDRALDNRQLISMQNIYDGICPSNTFRSIISDVDQLAWILTPPASYVASTTELLALSLKRVREILKFRLVDPISGSPDTKVGDLILKTAMMLDMRLKGGYVQRSQQMNYTETKSTVTHQAGTAPVQSLPEDPILSLDAKLTALEAQIEENKIKKQISSPIDPAAQLRSHMVVDKPDIVIEPEVE